MDYLIHKLFYVAERFKGLICQKLDDNFDDCFKKNFPKWLLEAMEGIPEFDLPPIDPLILESFSFERSLSDELKIAGALKNVAVFGAGKTVLEDFR